MKQQPQQPGTKEKVRGLTDQAMEILYGDDNNFSNMKALFEKAGPEGFQKTMSLVVNGVLDRMEQDTGQLPDNELAGLAAGVMILLSKDLMEAGLVNVDDKQMMATAQTIVSDWERGHQDRSQQATQTEAPQPAPQQPPTELPPGGFMS